MSINKALCNNVDTQLYYFSPIFRTIVWNTWLTSFQQNQGLPLSSGSSQASHTGACELFRPIFQQFLSSSEVASPLRGCPYVFWFPPVSGNHIYFRRLDDYFPDSGTLFPIYLFFGGSSDLTSCHLRFDTFGIKNMGVGSSSVVITSEPLMGSSNYLAWASSVELWCKGQGVQDHLMEKVCGRWKCKV